MTGGSLLSLRNLEAWYTPGRPVLFATNGGPGRASTSIIYYT